MEEETEIKYVGWPEHLYVIGTDEKIAHAGTMGLMGFDPDSREEAVKKQAVEKSGKRLATEYGAAGAGWGAADSLLYQSFNIDTKEAMEDPQKTETVTSHFSSYILKMSGFPYEQLIS